MNRCIAVLSPGRSGSSGTSGMLHKLGVSMGERFVQSDHNPLGTFEDAELMAFTTRVLRGQESLRAYVPLFEERAEQDLWGFKVPGFVEVAFQVLPLLCELAEVRLVLALRPREAAIASYERVYDVSREQARHWYDRRYWCLNTLLVNWSGPVMDLWWPVTLMDPMLQACRLAQFAFEGLGVPDRETVRRAAEHIQP